MLLCRASHRKRGQTWWPEHSRAALLVHKRAGREAQRPTCLRDAKARPAAGQKERVYRLVRTGNSGDPQAAAVLTCCCQECPMTVASMPVRVSGETEQPSVGANILLLRRPEHFKLASKEQERKQCAWPRRAHQLFCAAQESGPSIKVAWGSLDLVKLSLPGCHGRINSRRRCCSAEEPAGGPENDNHEPCHVRQQQQLSRLLSAGQPHMLRLHSQLVQPAVPPLLRWQQQ